jgi:hypothetical protein
MPTRHSLSGKKIEESLLPTLLVLDFDPNVLCHLLELLHRFADTRPGRFVSFLVELGKVTFLLQDEIFQLFEFAHF